MKKILYLILALCYCLLFGEFFVRLFSPAPLLPRYVTAAPYGIRINVPHAHYWQTTPEVQVQLRINSQGIRSDLEYTYDKPKDQCRILLLGDSFFMGYEVDLTDSFAYLLEQKLNAEGVPCQVINLAVSGYGTAEMLIALEQEGLKYQPDLVIFQWHITDPDDNVRSALFRIKDGELVRLHSTYLPAVKLSDWLSQFTLYRWLIENCQLYAALRETAAARIKSFLASLRKRQGEAAISKTTAAESPNLPQATEYALRLSTRLLQEAKRISNAHQAQFCVLEIPDRLGRTKFRSHITEFFTPQLRQELQILTPLPMFEATSSPALKLYYEKGHFHLTPEGNRLLTEYFGSELKKAGWLNH